MLFALEITMSSSIIKIIEMFQTNNNSITIMASYGGQAADGMRAQRLAKEREQQKGEQEFRKKKLADSMKVSYFSQLNCL